VIATVLALAAAATLSACGVATPQTALGYAASDGVDLQLGALEGANLLVLTAAKGDPGTLIGALANNGDVPLTVQIGTADSPTSVTVAAHGIALLGPDHTAVPLPAVAAPPGALLEISVQSDVTGSTSLQVPVLDGTLPAYAGLVPKP
jgi:hypothetical protein